jgi:DNA repair protein RadA
MQEYVPASQILKQRESLVRCTTGSDALDDFLLGGVETQAITELYGEFGSGKSQMCHSLCVTAQQPVENKGLGGKVIYIDTEGTFRPERVLGIARARGYPDEIVDGVIVVKPMNAYAFEEVIRTLGKAIDEQQAKLIIVDSVISLQRADFTGRGTLADRQQRLNQIMHKLIRFAEIYNIAIVITNQISSAPDVFYGDPTKATGGNVVGHASTYRIYLRKASKNKRVAKMIDSPYHPYGECPFLLTEKGVDDIEPEGEKKEE